MIRITLSNSEPTERVITTPKATINRYGIHYLSGEEKRTIFIADDGTYRIHNGIFDEVTIEVAKEQND